MPYGPRGLWPSWPRTFGCGRGRIVTGSHQGGFFFFAFIANDGGGAANNLVMLNVPVVKPKIKEITSLGVAFCAGLATRVWDSVDEIKTLWAVSQTYLPRMTEKERHRNWSGWNKAVLKSLGWIDPEDEEEQDRQETNTSTARVEQFTRDNRNRFLQNWFGAGWLFGGVDVVAAHDRMTLVILGCRNRLVLDGFLWHFLPQTRRLWCHQTTLVVDVVVVVVAAVVLLGDLDVVVSVVVLVVVVGVPCWRRRHAPIRQPISFAWYPDFLEKNFAPTHREFFKEYLAFVFIHARGGIGRNLLDDPLIV